MVDGIAWHASTAFSPEYLPEFYRQSPFWVERIVQTARKHSFKKDYP